MKHILVVVDMQTDFVDGALGTPEAVAILPAVADKIKTYAADPDGAILVTYDTHTEAYMDTAEGKRQRPVFIFEMTDITAVLKTVTISAFNNLCYFFAVIF